VLRGRGGGGGEEEKGKGSLAAGPDVSRHCAWEQEWIKRQICQCESEHVWKMCLPQPFHLLHRGAIATAWRGSVVSR